MGILSAGLGWNTWGIGLAAGVAELQHGFPSAWMILFGFATLLVPHVLLGLVAGFLASFIPHRRRLGASSWVGFGCGVLGLLLNFGVMFALQEVWPEVAPSLGEIGVVHFGTMAFGGVLAVFVVRRFVRR